METRNETIERIVTDYIRVTSVSWDTYSQSVLEHYHECVLSMKRSVKFHVGGDVFKDGRANAQLVGRLLRGDVRMPVEIEESLIEALPDEWRKNLKSVLATRMGLLASPIPGDKTSVEFRHIGQMAKEFGDLLSVVSEAYEDDTFDNNDAHLADRILKEGCDLMAMVTTVMHKAEQINKQSKVHFLNRNKG